MAVLRQEQRLPVTPPPGLETAKVNPEGKRRRGLPAELRETPPATIISFPQAPESAKPEEPPFLPEVASFYANSMKSVYEQQNQDFPEHLQEGFFEREANLDAWFVDNGLPKYELKQKLSEVFSSRHAGVLNGFVEYVQSVMNQGNLSEAQKIDVLFQTVSQELSGSLKVLEPSLNTRAKFTEFYKVGGLKRLVSILESVQQERESRDRQAALEQEAVLAATQAMPRVEVIPEVAVPTTEVLQPVIIDEPDALPPQPPEIQNFEIDVPTLHGVAREEELFEELSSEQMLQKTEEPLRGRFRIRTENVQPFAQEEFTRRRFLRSEKYRDYTDQSQNGREIRTLITQVNQPDKVVSYIRLNSDGTQAVSHPVPVAIDSPAAALLPQALLEASEDLRFDVMEPVRTQQGEEYYLRLQTPDGFIAMPSAALEDPAHMHEQMNALLEQPFVYTVYFRGNELASGDRLERERVGAATLIKELQDLDQPLVALMELQQLLQELPQQNRHAREYFIPSSEIQTARAILFAVVQRCFNEVDARYNVLKLGNDEKTHTEEEKEEWDRVTRQHSLLKTVTTQYFVESGKEPAWSSLVYTLNQLLYVKDEQKKKAEQTLLFAEYPQLLGSVGIATLLLPRTGQTAEIRLTAEQCEQLKKQVVEYTAAHAIPKELPILRFVPESKKDLLPEALQVQLATLEQQVNALPKLNENQKIEALTEIHDVLQDWMQQVAEVYIQSFLEANKQERLEYYAQILGTEDAVDTESLLQLEQFFEGSFQRFQNLYTEKTKKNPESRASDEVLRNWLSDFLAITMMTQEKQERAAQDIEFFIEGLKEETRAELLEQVFDFEPIDTLSEALSGALQKWRSKQPRATSYWSGLTLNQENDFSQEVEEALSASQEAWSTANLSGEELEQLVLHWMSMVKQPNQLYRVGLPLTPGATEVSFSQVVNTYLEQKLPLLVVEQGFNNPADVPGVESLLVLFLRDYNNKEFATLKGARKAFDRLEAYRQDLVHIKMMLQGELHTISKVRNDSVLAEIKTPITDVRMSGALWGPLMRMATKMYTPVGEVADALGDKNGQVSTEEIRGFLQKFNTVLDNVYAESHAQAFNQLTLE